MLSKKQISKRLAAAKAIQGIILETFFLRFYGRTDEDIKKCADEINEAGFKFVKMNIHPAEMTMNTFVPNELLPVKELVLFFHTLDEAKSLHCEEVKQIYEKYSFPVDLKEKYNAIAIKRNYSDISFRI